MRKYLNLEQNETIQKTLLFRIYSGPSRGSTEPPPDFPGSSQKNKKYNFLRMLQVMALHYCQYSSQSPFIIIIQ